MTNADSWQTTHQYTEPGEYTINITAYNLHSEEEYGYNKYTHNITRVITIQNPVQDWTIDFGDPSKIIDSNGRKNTMYVKISVRNNSVAAYKAFLQYSKDKPLPTDPTLECNMGDGEIVSDIRLEDLDKVDDPELLKYTIAHEYTLSGEYNISCK